MKRNKFIASVFALSLMTFMGSKAQAVTNVYPGQSIQQAINNENDIVYINAGTYGERIVFPAGKCITVQAVGEVYLTCSSVEGPIITFETGANSTLDGLNITGNSVVWWTQTRNKPSDPGPGYVSGSGAGIYVYHASPIIKNCKLGKLDKYGSLQARYGGAIFCEYSNLTLIDCQLTGKLTRGIDGHRIMGGICGGGICSYNSTINLQGTTIAYAFSPSGGAIHFEVDNGDASLGATLSNCSLLDNDANGCPVGTINVTSNNPATLLNISDSNISRNYGAAASVAVFGASMRLTRCRVEENYLHPDIHLLRDKNPIPILLDENMSNGARGNLDIVNCVIARNKDPQETYYYPPTAIIFRGKTMNIINSTIADNQCALSMYARRDVEANIINSIVWGNVWGISSNTPSYFNVQGSDIQGGWAGAGNINADPLFADASYTLSPNSPCVDTGLNTYPGLPADDIDLNIRPMGYGYDMGAYEFQEDLLP